MAYNTFVDMAVDVAGAIREKEGSSALVPVQEFGQRILALPTGGGTGEWQPNPTWWDIESVIRNDTSGYTGKYIMLLPDADNTTTIAATTYAAVYKTSDGATYTGTSMTHTWDRSKDKPCNLGYSTRWVMIYVTQSATDSGAQVQLSVNDNMLYLIIDKIKINFTGLSSKYLLQKIKLINGANKHSVTAGVAFTNNMSLVNIDDTFDFTGLTTVSGMFSGCSQLRSAVIDMQTVSTGGAIFSNCYNISIANLKNMSVSTQISSASYGVMIGKSSLLYIINNLVDKTGLTAQTLTMGATNIGKLKPEEIAIATAKNWTIA